MPNYSDTMQKMLADFHVIGIKLHKYHWNVKGLQFFAVHEMTEGFYNYFFKIFDDVAERMLQLGCKPAATVKEYLSLATIAEETRENFTATEVLQSIQADFQALLAEAKALFAAAEAEKDITTTDVMTGHIAWLEKNLWMLGYALDQK